jgi:hypothetical protein
MWCETYIAQAYAKYCIRHILGSFGVLCKWSRREGLLIMTTNSDILLLPYITIMNNMESKRKRTREIKTRINVVRQCVYVHISAAIFNNDLGLQHNIFITKPYCTTDMKNPKIPCTVPLSNTPAPPQPSRP